MEATKARGELTDNPFEYHQYILNQLNQQVCMVLYSKSLFLPVSNDIFCKFIQSGSFIYNNMYIYIYYYKNEIISKIYYTLNS